MHIAIDARPAPARAIVWGLILLAPGAVFQMANILNDLGIAFLYNGMARVIDAFHGAGIDVTSPVVLLGGLAAALLLNALAMAPQLDLAWRDNTLVGTVALEPRIPNVALIVGVALMLTFFVAYAFVENFRLVSTHSG